MRRIVVLLVIIILIGCDSTLSDYSAVFDGTGGQWVDLTHSFSESTIYWPTDTTGFVLEEQAYGLSEGGWFYASYQFEAAEHGGRTWTRRFTSARVAGRMNKFAVGSDRAGCSRRRLRPRPCGLLGHRGPTSLLGRSRTVASRTRGSSF